MWQTLFYSEIGTQKVELVHLSGRGFGHSESLVTPVVPSFNGTSDDA